MGVAHLAFLAVAYMAHDTLHPTPTLVGARIELDILIDVLECCLDARTFLIRSIRHSICRWYGSHSL